MFLDESSPVRTPSYMPRLSAYFWFQRDVSRERHLLELGISGNLGPALGERKARMP